MRTLRTLSRWALVALLAAAGVAHLATLRRGFRIVVPDWATRLLRTDKDTIVVVSGVVEIVLAAVLVALPRERGRIAAAVAAFFVAVFPGNIAQAAAQRAAFGLDNDRARIARLFFQPVLVAWALWSTRER